MAARGRQGRAGAGAGARRARAPAAAPNEVRLLVAHPGAGRALPRRLEALAHAFLAAQGLAGCELSLSLVGDRAIRRLNRTWRRKDEPTDVLSFPAGEAPPGAPGPRVLGDVVISLDTARRQARAWERTLEAEVARYLAHGLLHLLGHDHQRAAEARRMAAAEEHLLGEQGMLGSHAPLTPRKRARVRGRAPGFAPAGSRGR